MSVESDLNEIVTYPILTREVGSSPGGDRGGSASENGRSRASSLTGTAQNAIRDLLGWRYRANDPKGFLSALTKAVDLDEKEGHIEYKWTTRPLMIQADLGAVTGAQASIYARAAAALEQVVGLIDNLKPLKPDADEQEVESIRALVRSAWQEMVAELGLGSGPRIQRVEQYFIQLLGSANPDVVRPVLGNGALVAGDLGRMARRFGLQRNHILMVNEEQNYTNFLIIVDYTASLLQTWSAQKPLLARGGFHDKFLGTQLVRLSEQFEVIAEAVQEVYDAMDSVNFGPEERQVSLITFPAHMGLEPITVAELFGWIQEFANVEARHLVENCGRDGVNAVNKTLDLFTQMITTIPD